MDSIQFYHSNWPLVTVFLAVLKSHRQVWLFDKLKHKRAPMVARLMELIVSVVLFVLMLAVPRLYRCASKVRVAS